MLPKGWKTNLTKNILPTRLLVLGIWTNLAEAGRQCYGFQIHCISCIAGSSIHVPQCPRLNTWCLCSTKNASAWS